MIRLLSLATALAVLPLSAAVAGQPEGPPRSQTVTEAAAEAFEARMETFGARAEAISGDNSLTEPQRDARIAALWAEYQPEVAVFTAAVSRHAGAIAQAALANVDLHALVESALKSPEVKAVLTGAAGMAANGAWAQNDPEQMVTYGLMAQYGLDQIADRADAAKDAASDAVEDN